MPHHGEMQPLVLIMLEEWKGREGCRTSSVFRNYLILAWK